MGILEEIAPYLLTPSGKNFIGFLGAALGIAFGGAIGAYSRYCITIFFVRYKLFYLPFGILCANLLGSFLIGFGTSLFLLHETSFASFLSYFSFVGLLGALTTFSTFAYDSFTLWINGEGLKALINIFVTIIIGFVFALIGFLLPLF